MAGIFTAPQVPGLSIPDVSDYAVRSVLGTSYTKLKDRFPVIDVKADHGAKGDGVTDDAAAIQAAFTAAAGRGIFFPDGTYLVGTSLLVSPNTRITGAGQYATTLKLKANANTDLLRNAGASAGGVVIENIAFDGNDANNASGRAIEWNTGSGTFFPAVELRNVYVHHFRGGANGEAVHFTGSVGVRASNLQIAENRYARGMFLQTPDGSWTDLYMINNGGNSGLESLVVRATNSNRFTNAYFGGGSGNAQVLVWGGIRTEFIGCTNDSAWTHGYRFLDANEAAVVGGVVTNPSQAATNVSDHIHIEGTSARTRIVGVTFQNEAAWSGKYALNNVGTGTGNYDVGSTFGTMGTAAYGTWAAAGVAPGSDAGAVQAGRVYQGSGVPNNANGNNGDTYFRTDTPGTANQRLYVKSAGAWVGIL